MALNADDDTISQIIKYQRRSPEPYDCAGLDVYLLDENLRDIKDQIMLPLLENFEAEYIKAHTACKQWMDYMTGVIWQSACCFLLAYKDIMLTSSYQIPRSWLGRRDRQYGSNPFPLDRFGA